MSEKSSVISNVRAALGRTERLVTPPPPPAIDEPITRTIFSDVGLQELFVKSAKNNSVQAELISVDELHEKLIAFLNERSCKRIALPASKLLDKLKIAEVLAINGFECKRWDEITLDEVYDFDAGLTDVYAAVAETGSVVVRSGAGNGRALSLVPPVHIAIVEPKNLLADLVDLFQKMGADGVASSVSIITGPSKTSDIEMNLVVGVHGPVVIKVFVL